MFEPCMSGTLQCLKSATRLRMKVLVALQIDSNAFYFSGTADHLNRRIKTKKLNDVLTSFTDWVGQKKADSTFLKRGESQRSCVVRSWRCLLSNSWLKSMIGGSSFPFVMWSVLLWANKQQLVQHVVYWQIGTLPCLCLLQRMQCVKILMKGRCKCVSIHLNWAWRTVPVNCCLEPI